MGSVIPRRHQHPETTSDTSRIAKHTRIRGRNRPQNKKKARGQTYWPLADGSSVRGDYRRTSRCGFRGGDLIPAALLVSKTINHCKQCAKPIVEIVTIYFSDSLRLPQAKGGTVDIRQLRALLAVGEHRSFSGAARALHTVQSNVSTHINHLEAELGTTLVDRATNELTYEGQLVASRSQRIEAELNAIIHEVASTTGHIVGSVHIGVVGTTARWLVPALLGRQSETHPAIAMTIADGTSSLLVPQLVTGRLDIAVINLPQSERTIRVEPMFTEDRVLIVPNNHSLAGRSQLTLADLAGHELLLEPKGTFFRDQLDTYGAQHGFELHAKAEIDGLRLLASMAFAGHGAAILPATAAPNWLEGEWTTVAITDAPKRTVGIARRRSGILAAAQQAVYTLIQEIVAESIPTTTGLHPPTPLNL